jgi:arylsulfatase A-like enzyme
VAPLALGLLALIAGASGCSETASSRPSILLVTLDTTRADHLGCYGSEAATSPHLDALAAESVRYTRALSTSSWTLPAHASILTGKFTRSHGARADAAGPIRLSSAIEGPRSWRRVRARGLSPRERTLPVVLAEHGYATAAVVAGPWLKRVMGVDLGFQSYDDSGITSMNGRLAEDVTDAALRWLRQRPEAPFFLFLNYFDPHDPYKPPREFLRGKAPRRGKLDAETYRRRLTRWAYQGEIRYMDHHLGRLLGGLRSLGVYDDTWIIVTSDHGELLGEHGIYGHGTTLHEPLLEIPLILKYPGSRTAPDTREEQVQLVDLLPTILNALGLAIPPDVQGSPLGRRAHPLIAEVYPLPFLEHARGDFRMLREENDKFVWHSGGDHRLFDLVADPDETVDLAERRPEQAQSMRARLDDYLARLPAPSEGGEPRQVDAATEEALRGLGYLE